MATGKGRELRLELAHRSVLDFMQVYMRDAIQNEFSDFHHLVGSMNERAILNNERLLIALPREHAKTTIFTTANIVREACLNRGKDHILLIKRNQTEADSALLSVFEQLDNNELLLKDFPGIKPKLKPSGVQVRDKGSEKILTNGVRIIGRGIDSPVRGYNYMNRRLKLIILDDPEDDKMQRSLDVLQQNWDWLQGSLIPALDMYKGTIVWMGSILSWNSLLRRAMLEMDPTEWRQRKWSAFADSKCTIPLWSERYTVEALAKRRREVGEKKWYAEYMNDPINPDEQAFKPAFHRTYDPQAITRKGSAVCYMDPRGDTHVLDVYMCMDLALGDTKKHDWSVIWVNGVDRQAPHWIYVLEILKFRGIGLNTILDRYTSQYKIWNPLKAGCEEIGFQKLVGDALRNRGLHVIPIKSHRGTKIERIEASAIPFEQRSVLLPRGHEVAEEFWRDAMQFPNCQQWDLLDTWAMTTTLPTNAGRAMAAASRRKTIGSRVTEGFVRMKSDDGGFTWKN